MASWSLFGTNACPMLMRVEVTLQLSPLAVRLSIYLQSFSLVPPGILGNLFFYEKHLADLLMFILTQSLYRLTRLLLSFIHLSLTSFDNERWCANISPEKPDTPKIDLCKGLTNIQKVSLHLRSLESFDLWLALSHYTN